MNSTSLTPTSLSVPPDFGAPVPGFSALPSAPPVDPVDDEGEVDDPDEPPLLDGELLHAAASTVTPTAATAPMALAFRRKCLTTLLLLKIYSAKIVHRAQTAGGTPRGGYSHALLLRPQHRWGEWGMK
jgi:hypothetical protein